MAKKQTKEKSIEETLWESANKLRGSVESSEYKHVVLGLIFLKFASDKFEEHRKKLIDDGKEKYIEMVEFYTMKNVFYLPEISRWSYIIENAKQDDIALKIDTALHTIEKNNPALKGALPDNYFSRLIWMLVNYQLYLIPSITLIQLKTNNMILLDVYMNISLSNLPLQKEKEKENSILQKVL